MYPGPDETSPPSSQICPGRTCSIAFPRGRRPTTIGQQSESGTRTNHRPSAYLERVQHTVLALPVLAEGSVNCGCSVALFGEFSCSPEFPPFDCSYGSVSSTVPPGSAVVVLAMRATRSLAEAVVLSAAERNGISLPVFVPWVYEGTLFRRTAERRRIFAKVREFGFGAHFSRTAGNSPDELNRALARFFLAVGTIQM